MPEYGLATREIRYRTMIVDVLDGNRVVVSNRVFASGYEIKIGNVVTLDGLDAPGLGERGGHEARESLSEWVLGKQVNIHETLDMGVSRGVVLFATEFPSSFLQEDNVNLKMLKAGLAKWKGNMVTDSVSQEAMMDAQHCAQKEGRGIWKSVLSTTNNVAIDVLDLSSNPSKKPGGPAASVSLGEPDAEPIPATSPQPVNPPPRPRRRSSSFAPLVVFSVFAAPIAIALAYWLNKRR